MKSKNFFSDPLAFSFKDSLAIAFTLEFFVLTALACLGNEHALTLVNEQKTLIAIVLTGYFAQETVSVFAKRNQTIDTEEESEAPV